MRPRKAGDPDLYFLFDPVAPQNANYADKCLKHAHQGAQVWLLPDFLNVIPRISCKVIPPEEAVPTTISC